MIFYPKTLVYKFLERICFQFTLKPNYNTGQSIYDFFLRQQDDSKKTIHATVTYKDSFSNYMKYFIDDIDAETVDKFDFFNEQKC